MRIEAIELRYLYLQVCVFVTLYRSSAHIFLLFCIDRAPVGDRPDFCVVNPCTAQEHAVI